MIYLDGFEPIGLMTDKGSASFLDNFLPFSEQCSRQRRRGVYYVRERGSHLDVDSLVVVVVISTAIYASSHEVALSKF
jgi:hypothetical protein